MKAMTRISSVVLGMALMLPLGSACIADAAGPSTRGRATALAAQGKHIFRYDTFGDEAKWTDQLRMHEVIRTAVDPVTALSVGLKVDVDALPRRVRKGIGATYGKSITRAQVHAGHQALLQRLDTFRLEADADLAALLQSLGRR